MATFDGDWCIMRMRQLCNDPLGETFTAAQARDLFDASYFKYVARLGDGTQTFTTGSFSGRQVVWSGAAAGITSNQRFHEIASNHSPVGSRPPLDQRSYNEVAWLQENEGVVSNNVRMVAWQIEGWVANVPQFRFIVYPIPTATAALVLVCMGNTVSAITSSTYPVDLQPNEIDTVIRMAAADMAFALKRPQDVIDEILRPVPSNLLISGQRRAWRYDQKSRIPDDQTLAVGPIALPG